MWNEIYLIKQTKLIFSTKICITTSFLIHLNQFAGCMNIPSVAAGAHWASWSKTPAWACWQTRTSLSAASRASEATWTRWCGRRRQSNPETFYRMVETDFKFASLQSIASTCRMSSSRFGHRLATAFNCEGERFCLSDGVAAAAAVDMNPFWKINEFKPSRSTNKTSVLKTFK